MSNWHNEHIMQWYRRRIKAIINSKRFGGIANLRNALNYFMRRNEGMKFSTKVGYPDKDMVYVKRIS